MTSHGYGNGKGTELLRWAVGLVLAALVSYFTAVGTLQTRVSVLEDRYDRLMTDVAEIKGDVKQLLQRGSR